MFNRARSRRRRYVVTMGAVVGIYSMLMGCGEIQVNAGNRTFMQECLAEAATQDEINRCHWENARPRK